MRRRLLLNVLQCRARRCRSAQQQEGFTLLEVLVALVLIGSGMAVAFTAISGSTRVTEKATGHTAAMVLARAKLDEVLASQDFKISDDAGEDKYGGVDYGYRIQATPVPLLTAAQQNRIPGVRPQLEEVSIEVFWGPTGAKQSYVLRTWRTLASAAAPNPAAQQPSEGNQ